MQWTFQSHFCSRQGVTHSMKIDLSVILGCMGWFPLLATGTLANYTDKSGVCSRGQGSRYNKSCSSQVHGKLCLFEVQKNSTSCHSHYFIPESKGDLGSIELAAYCYRDQYFILSALNVSMKNTKWTEINLRFKFKEHNFYICVNIKLDNEAASLFYDCVLTDKLDIDNKVMQLEYMASDKETIQSGVYNFIGPCCNNTEKICGTRLMYFDWTDHSELTLHIQKLPSDVNFDEFIINKCFINCGTMIDRINCAEDDCNVYRRVPVTTSGEEILETINISGDEGCFYLSLQTSYNNVAKDACLAYTPIISKSGHLWFLMPLILGSLTVLVALLAFFYLFRRYHKRNSADENGSAPTLLLIHNPVHRAHTKVVKELANLLSNFCGVDVMLDLKDINKSESKDPLLWYSIAVTKTRYIAVISTPPCRNSRDTLFNNLFDIGLRYTKEQLANCSSEGFIFTILLPYCSRDHITSEVQSLQCFKMMNDFVNMVCHMHQYRLCWFDKYITVRKTLASRIQCILGSNGNKLNCAIQDMTDQLSSFCDEEYLSIQDNCQLISLKGKSKISYGSPNLQIIESSETQNDVATCADVVHITQLDLLAEKETASDECKHCEIVVGGDSLIL